MLCTSCGIELKVAGFREAETRGDCYPLCSACASRFNNLPRPVRRTLLRRIYSSGRTISRCHSCGATGELEVHFIRPLVSGGTDQSANLLLLCTRCHDKVHLGARIRGRVTRIDKGDRQGGSSDE